MGVRRASPPRRGVRADGLCALSKRARRTARECDTECARRAAAVQAAAREGAEDRRPYLPDGAVPAPAELPGVPHLPGRAPPIFPGVLSHRLQEVFGEGGLARGPVDRVLHRLDALLEIS